MRMPDGTSVEFKPEDTGVALDGDKILARIIPSGRGRFGNTRGAFGKRRKPDFKGDDGKKYARVVRILERKTYKVVGTLRRSYNFCTSSQTTPNSSTTSSPPTRKNRESRRPRRERQSRRAAKRMDTAAHKPVGRNNRVARREPHADGRVPRNYRKIRPFGNIPRQRARGSRKSSSKSFAEGTRGQMRHARKIHNHNRSGRRKGFRRRNLLRSNASATTGKSACTSRTCRTTSGKTPRSTRRRRRGGIPHTSWER